MNVTPHPVALPRFGFLNQVEPHEAAVSAVRLPSPLSVGQQQALQKFLNLITERSTLDDTQTDLGKGDLSFPALCKGAPAHLRAEGSPHLKTFEDAQREQFRKAADRVAGAMVATGMVKDRKAVTILPIKGSGALEGDIVGGRLYVTGPVAHIPHTEQAAKTQALAFLKREPDYTRALRWLFATLLEPVVGETRDLLFPGPEKFEIVREKLTEALLRAGVFESVDDFELRPPQVLPRKADSEKTSIQWGELVLKAPYNRAATMRAMPPGQAWTPTWKVPRPRTEP